MEPTTNLYRQQAARASGLRWFGKVPVALPPSTLAAVLTAVSACALLVLATIVIEIPDSVTANGVLLPAGGLLRLRAPRAGRVEQVAVDNGDSVSAGRLLLRISGLEHAPGQRPALTDRIASLERERELVRQGLQLDLQAAAERIANHRRRTVLLRRRIEAAGDELHARRDTAGHLRARADRVTSLAESGVMARQVVDELAAAARQAEAASLVTAGGIAALEDELAVISGALRQDTELRLRLESDAAARLEAIDRDIAARTLDATIAVTAPDSGRVTGLAVRDGDIVAPGQVLLTIHDPAERLEARLYLPAGRAIPIEPGQSVELQLDAYPHEFHGTRTAIVTDVSSAAAPAADLVAGFPIGGNVFEIRASLDAPSVLAGGRSRALPPGTQVSAEIVQHRWPLYRWILRGLRDSQPAP